ncbi:MAG: DUF3100 domain-containing protein [Micropruina sp.]|uniref:DUF3100 domain-containing protein n=1 Tax=Micropruina sp. TaxID=2737536 RepID=UPI0039E56218
MTLRDKRLWIIVGLAIVIACIAQAIGPAVIPLGIASVTLLPMIWGLLLAGSISGQTWRPLGRNLQDAATSIMGVAVLFLGARLSLEIGPSIPLLLQAGPALLLQELGHLFGTLLLALPLAVLLRMGPATVGATFSIDREGSFAMVSERYGSDSPQYRGVLSMYVFGTVFGAIIVSLIASLATSLGIFDPLALAMGAGVGSGSMMAAAASVIIAQHPEMQQQVLALSAASNLITNVLGLYVGVWVALPAADKMYKALSKRWKQPEEKAGNAAEMEAATASLLETRTSVPLGTSLLIFSGAGLLVAMIAKKTFSFDMVITFVLLSALVAISIWLSNITKHRIPAIVSGMTLGALATSPISPIGTWVSHTAESVNFLSIITAMLTIAGLGIGKDLPLLKNIGWKIIPTGVVAIAASFILSAVVAEFALGAWGR